MIFFKVSLAECEIGGRKVETAVKTMRCQMTRDTRAAFMKEARLMRKYSHPHIVRIIGKIIVKHLPKVGKFETTVLSFCNIYRISSPEPTYNLTLTC